MESAASAVSDSAGAGSSVGAGAASAVGAGVVAAEDALLPQAAKLTASTAAVKREKRRFIKSTSLLFVNRRNHQGVGSQLGGVGLIVTLILVQRGNLLHFLVRQGEVVNIEVVADVIRILGAGDDDVARLHVPAQDDLGITLTVLGSKAREQWLIQ